MRYSGKFPQVESGEIYLDNAATTLTPTDVLRAMNNYYENFNSNVHRGLYNSSRRATQEYEKSRKRIAEFFNVNQDEIVFTQNTTHAINQIANSLHNNNPLSIVATEMDHHSNLVPWQQLARKNEDTDISYISISENNINIEEAAKILGESVDVLVFPHISNTLGTITPVNELVEMANKNNIMTICDGAQSAGHFPVNLHDMGVDFFVCSGHKMLGPTGVGLFYGQSDILETLEPSVFGGGMVSKVSLEESTWTHPPKKFEAGTPPIAEVIGLSSAIDFLEQEGMENIQSHSAELTRYLYKKLENNPDVSVLSPDTSSLSQYGPIVSFQVDNAHPHDVAEILGQNDIAVRAGDHCTQPLHNSLDEAATVRASFHVYNTKEDIEQLYNCLEEEVIPIFSK